MNSIIRGIWGCLLARFCGGAGHRVDGWGGWKAGADGERPAMAGLGEKEELLASSSGGQRWLLARVGLHSIPLFHPCWWEGGVGRGEQGVWPG